MTNPSGRLEDDHWVGHWGRGRGGQVLLVDGGTYNNLLIIHRSPTTARRAPTCPCLINALNTRHAQLLATLLIIC